MKKKSDLKLMRQTHVCLFLTVPSAPTQEGLNDGGGDDVMILICWAGKQRPRKGRRPVPGPDLLGSATSIGT